VRAFAWLLTLSLTATACASTASVSVRPAQGQDAAQLERDRAACEAEAEEGRDRWILLKGNLRAVLLGLGVGAVTGVAAVFLSHSSVSSCDDARRLAGVAAGGAAVGAALGLIVGHVATVDAAAKQEQIFIDRYARCLDRRGYWVAPAER
jgi:hypothetical protein